MPLLPSPRVELDEALLRRAVALAAGARAGILREEGLRARAAGAGYEFERYREYQPGDDPREIDWDLAARDPEHLAVRVRRSEQGARWRILVDDSASMGLGARGKLQCAAELALALAALGLELGASIEVISFSNRVSATLEHANELASLMQALSKLVASGASSLPQGLSRGRVQREFVLSDFSAPECLPRILTAQRGRRSAALEILALDEREPPESGEWILVDPESGAERALAASPARAAQYRAALEARSHQLETLARTARAECVHLCAAQPLEVAFARVREVLRG